MDKSPLTLAIDRDGDSAVVHCAGRLVSGESESFYSQISQLIPRHKRIVLDLTNLTHMDSMGLGTLIRVYVSTKSAGCRLELINLGPRIRQLLGMTNLLSVFNAYGEYGIRIP